MFLAGLSIGLVEILVVMLFFACLLAAAEAVEKWRADQPASQAKEGWKSLLKQWFQKGG